MLKKCSLVALIALSSCAFAETAPYNPGPYVGIQGGLGLADEGDFFSKAVDTLMDSTYGNRSSEKNRGGAAGRIFLGYNIAQYFSVELGYALLANNTYKYKNDTFNLYQNFKSQTYYFDLVGKLILPLGNSNWNLYAKFGGAYVHSKYTAETNAFNGVRGNQNYNALCPAYGLGVTYNFNENFSMDLSWLGTYSSNHANWGDNNIDSKKPVATTNAFMLGVAYKFTQL